MLVSSCRPKFVWFEFPISAKGAPRFFFLISLLGCGAQKAGGVAGLDSCQLLNINDGVRLLIIEYYRVLVSLHLKRIKTTGCP